MIETTPAAPTPMATKEIDRRDRPSGREQELKFTLDDAAFKAAQALPLFGRPAIGPAWRRVRTTYFDTDLRDLRRNNITLRMRQVRGGYLMGLKWSSSSGRDVFERGELEVKAPSSEPDFTRFGGDLAANIAATVGNRPLKPVFVSEIRRSTRTLKIGASTIEVAFDSGFLIAGERREPVREIELELKQGDPTALYRFGITALDALPLSLGVLSKAARGWQLLSSEAPAPARAKPPEITPQTSVDEAIGVLLRECLFHFTANWPVATSGNSTEAVHQMRVSMRRLRAAIGFFHRIFPCQDFADFRAEAKRIATAMGQARDWDVFNELVRSGPLEYFQDAPGFAPLLSAAQQKADGGHTKALAVIGEKSAARFVLSMEEFISRRGWRNSVADERLAEFAGPIANFAAKALERLDRKVRRRGRRFGSLTPEARHELRIALKSVRYASEFFGHLFLPRSAVRRYTQRAAALQDLLGELNDATVVARMAKQLDMSAGADTAYAAGLVAGWCGRSGVGDDVACKSAWRSLQKSERYWRDHLASSD